VLDMLICCPD